MAAVSSTPRVFNTQHIKALTDELRDPNKRLESSLRRTWYDIFEPGNNGIGGRNLVSLKEFLLSSGREIKPRVQENAAFGAACQRVAEQDYVRAYIMVSAVTEGAIEAHLGSSISSDFAMIGCSSGTRELGSFRDGTKIEAGKTYVADEDIALLKSNAGRPILVIDNMLGSGKTVAFVSLWLKGIGYRNVDMLGPSYQFESVVANGSLAGRYAMAFGRPSNF